jgi:hypothetical protein
MKEGICIKRLTDYDVTEKLPDPKANMNSINMIAKQRATYTRGSLIFVVIPALVMHTILCSNMFVFLEEKSVFFFIFP